MKLVGERRPEIGIQIYYATHVNAQDLRGFPELLAKADIYIPEVPFWTRDIVQAYQAVASGRLEPHVALPRVIPDGNQYYFLRKKELELLHNSGKLIGVADIHRRSRLVGQNQIGIFLRNRLSSDLEKEKEKMSEEDYSRLLQRVKMSIRRSGNNIVAARDDHMLTKVPVVLERALKQRPRLLERDQVNALMFLGAGHWRVGKGLKAQGFNVTHQFSQKPFVYDYESKAVNLHLLGKEVSNELAARVAAELVIKIATNHASYDSRFDSSKMDRATRILVNSLTDDEIKSIFTRNIHDQTYAQRLAEMVEEKGLFIPDSVERVERFLRVYENPSEQEIGIRLRDGRQTDPISFRERPVRMILPGGVVLGVGKPAQLGLAWMPDDCVIVDRTSAGELDGEIPNYRVLNNDEEVLLGRENPEGFDFETSVSRRHVGIKRIGDEVLVRDLNSTNGTKVVFRNE